MFQAKYNNTKIIPKEYLPSIHEKKIYCTYCDNSMIFINGIKNVKHFRHVNNEKKCILYDKINRNFFLRESEEHLEIKNELYNYFKSFIENNGKIYTEYKIGGIDDYRKADIYIEFLYNNALYKTIIEVQLSYNNFEEINDRTNFYKNHGIDNIIWICTLEKSGLTLNFNEVQKHIIYYIKEGILGYAYYKKELNQIFQNNYSRYKDYSFYHKKIINEKQKINKNDSFVENIKLDKLGYDFLISGNSNYLEQIINNDNKKEDLRLIEHKKESDEYEKKLHERIKNSKNFYKVDSNFGYKFNNYSCDSNNNLSSTNETYTPYEEELKIDFKLKLENNDIIDKEISVGDYVIVNDVIKILKKGGFFKKFNARQSFYRVKKVINGNCIGNSDIKDKDEYGYCRNGFKKELLIIVSAECYLKNFGSH